LEIIWFHVLHRQMNSIRRIIKTISANRKKAEIESINLKP
jgi:hypothetical protein